MPNAVGLRRFTLVILAAFAAVSLFGQAPLVEQGRVALARGDTDAAIEILEKAVAQSPASAEAYYALGSAYIGRVQAGGMFTAARYVSRIRDAFEKAVSLNPRSVEARFGLVQVYAGAPGVMGGSYEKALAQAEEIRAIDPVVGHQAYAFVYSQQKKVDLARKEFADAIREQPDSAKAHSFFGQHLANFEKDYPAAFAEFEAALKVDPDYMPAFYQLRHTAALARTNLVRGEEALKKYLAYTPKENEPPLANAHSQLGAVYENQGKKAEARQCYQAALKLNPTLKQASEGLKRVS